MEMSTVHWGEIQEPAGSDFFVPDVTADIQKSMDEFCLNEYDNDDDNLQIEEIRLPPMCPLVMYSISLQKYCNNMTEMIRLAELAIEANLIPTEDAKPQLPKMPEINFKHKPNSLNFIPKDFTDFSTGKEVDVPEISEAVVKKLLTKCIATMFAHIGYETSHQSILDLLTDVLEGFFEKISGRIVDATEEEEKGDTAGFPHVIERVLTEMGLGGVKGINDYYQSRVIKYIAVLQRRCAELDNHYAALLVPKSESPTGEIGSLYKVKVKKEEDSQDSENPELHFTMLDGDLGLSLEPGYQILNSLEANSQSFAEADVEMPSSSLGVVSIPSEAEFCNSSPFQKKRFNMI